MSEFNYFTDDFFGLQQLFPNPEYTEEFYLWDERPFDNNFSTSSESVDYCSSLSNSSVQFNGVDQHNTAYSSNGNVPVSSYSWQPTSTTPPTSLSSPNQLYDIDQKTYTVCTDPMSSFMDTNFINSTDLDKYNIGFNSNYSIENCDFETLLFDNNYIESTINALNLPDKTYICNDSCNMFLKESSENLNSQLQIIQPNENYMNVDGGHIIPTTIEDTFNTSSNHMAVNTPKIQKTVPVKSQNSGTDDDKTFICTYGDCRKVYAKAGHLKAHLRRHVGDKPYVCHWPNCTWKFSRSDELSRHRRSHSGIKPYKCDYCTKCFSRSDHLTKHRKVHERKMAALKIKAVWTNLPLGRPGRRPKNLENRNLTVEQ